MFPLLTKRKEGNNQFKNNRPSPQNCQKIELYGSPITKELKKKHSFRLVGGAEMDSWGEEDSWQGGGWWTRKSHIHVWINGEEQMGNESDCTAQGSSMGKESLRTSGCKKAVGVVVAGETACLLKPALFLLWALPTQGHRATTSLPHPGN